MSEKPFVSVVTPFYNTAGYLRECIESVLSQTYTNFEYLLVDNQSTDGSASIAAEYAAKDERVRVIRNPKFVGQVPNYNGALRHVDSTARYVKVVQADASHGFDHQLLSPDGRHGMRRRRRMAD